MSGEFESLFNFTPEFDVVTTGDIERDIEGFDTSAGKTFSFSFGGSTSKAEAKSRQIKRIEQNIEEARVKIDFNRLQRQVRSTLRSGAAGIANLARQKTGLFLQEAEVLRRVPEYALQERLVKAKANVAGASSLDVRRDLFRQRVEAERAKIRNQMEFLDQQTALAIQAAIDTRLDFAAAKKLKDLSLAQIALNRKALEFERNMQRLERRRKNIQSAARVIGTAAGFAVGAEAPLALAIGALSAGTAGFSTGGGTESLIAGAKEAVKIYASAKAIQGLSESLGSLFSSSGELEEQLNTAVAGTPRGGGAVLAPP